MSTCKVSSFIVLLCIAASAGCQSSTTSTKSSDGDSQGTKYVLTSEPKDAKTPTEVKESVVEPTKLAIAGRIDAGDLEPFQEGAATFILSQLPDAAHAGGDANHADNCPFCKRKLRSAPKAVVQFVDASGSVLPIDARKLLGVAKGDVVVVQGTAEYLEAVNTVQMTADGIFIR